MHEDVAVYFDRLLANGTHQLKCAVEVRAVENVSGYDFDQRDEDGGMPPVKSDQAAAGMLRKVAADFRDGYRRCIAGEQRGRGSYGCELFKDRTLDGELFGGGFDHSATTIYRAA